MMGNLTAAVDVYLEQLMKDNTKKAYGPKVKEFQAFCDHVYPTMDSSADTRLGLMGCTVFFFTKFFVRKRWRVGGRGG